MPPNFPNTTGTGGCRGIPRPATDAKAGTRISSCGMLAASCLPRPASQAECCGNCTEANGCTAWIFKPSSGTCWLMASVSGSKAAPDRVLGGYGPGLATGIGAAISSPSGAVLWRVDDLSSVAQDLNWPAPNTATAYAIKDFPRFHAPPWGPTPMPTDAHKLDPGMGPSETNGYDFSNLFFSKSRSMPTANAQDPCRSEGT